MTTYPTAAGSQPGWYKKAFTVKEAYEEAKRTAQQNLDKKIADDYIRLTNLPRDTNDKP